MAYVGSKARLAPIFIPLFNSIIERKNCTIYIEPFVEGGNIFDGISCDEKIGYDKSKTLIALFNQGIEDLSKIPEQCDKELWDKAKSEYRQLSPQTLPDYLIGAVQFFGSYGAKGFQGGWANNINGRIYYNERYRNFKKQMERLRNTGGKFINAEYQNIEIPNNAFVYCDPPYSGTISYDFEDKYFNHTVYWNWVREISKRAYVICSEQSCPNDFEIVWKGELARWVSSKNNVKGNEILCVYKNGLLKSEDIVL